MIAIHCPGRKKDPEHRIWQPLGGIKSLGGGEFVPPPKKMSGINAASRPSCTTHSLVTRVSVTTMRRTDWLPRNWDA